MKMRRKRGIALTILCTALLGLPQIASAQAVDTSWLDWKLLDAPEYRRKTEIWKKIPLSVTRIIGPHISCSLP